MPTSMQTPRFIKAATAKALERLMFANNIKRKAWHQYTIVWDGKAWYAWYYVDVGGEYNQEAQDLTTDKS